MGPLTIPTLSINSTFFTNWDQVYPYTKAIVEEAARHSGRAISLEIQGSFHLSQSDFPLILNHLSLIVSGSKLQPSRCMDLNVNATIEFLGQVFPLDQMPLPVPGFESQLSKNTLNRLGVKRTLRRSYVEQRKEKVLQGDAEEVRILFERV